MAEALVLIDIQKDYFPGGRMELVNPEAAALKAKALLENFRARKGIIAHIQHLSSREGATFFLPGTPGVMIHESVLPLAEEKVISKHFPNSFRETELEEFLRDNGATSITFCGMMSHMCVDATVRAAFDKGFTCVVVDDACATRDLAHRGVKVPSRQVHTAYMAALGAVYATVVSSAEYLSQVGG